MSRTVGYCLYRPLLLHPRSAHPVQITAHHHIDVYIDINECYFESDCSCSASYETKDTNASSKQWTPDDIFPYMCKRKSKLFWNEGVSMDFENKGIFRNHKKM